MLGQRYYFRIISMIQANELERVIEDHVNMGIIFLSKYEVRQSVVFHTHRLIR